jgi:hypothetical protein
VEEETTEEGDATDETATDDTAPRSELAASVAEDNER